VPGEVEQVEQHADAEVVDGVVVREPAPVPAARSTQAAVVQAAAVAATSFVAGAATLAVVSRRRGAKPRKPAIRRSKPEPALEIIATRSFLVDVHQLGER
jgi:hypothetical protein